MPNQDIMQQALEIARAQAGVRPMTAAEVASYVSEVAHALEATIEGDGCCGSQAFHWRILCDLP